MKKENKRKVDRKLKSEISSVLCCIEITLQKYLQTRKKKRNWKLYKRPASVSASTIAKRW
jgi:hypothetical protein